MEINAHDVVQLSETWWGGDTSIGSKLMGKIMGGAGVVGTPVSGDHGKHPTAEREGGWDEDGSLMEDNGCELYNKCLTCPLPLCKEDVGIVEAKRAADEAGIAYNKVTTVTMQLYNLYKAGVGVTEAAAQTGMRLSNVSNRYISWGYTPKYKRMSSEAKTEVLEMLDLGVPPKDIAEKTGYKYSTITLIKRNRK